MITVQNNTNYKFKFHKRGVGIFLGHIFPKCQNTPSFLLTMSRKRVCIFLHLEAVLEVAVKVFGRRNFLIFHINLGFHVTLKNLVPRFSGKKGEKWGKMKFFRFYEKSAHGIFLFFFFFLHEVTTAQRFKFDLNVSFLGKILFWDFGPKWVQSEIFQVKSKINVWNFSGLFCMTVHLLYSPFL